ENNVKNEAKPTSLMDRLVEESKSKTKDVKKEVEDTKEDKSAKENNVKNEAKPTSLMDRLVEESKSKTKDVKKEVEDTKEDKSAKENNVKNEAKPTSLMDRLVQESKSKTKDVKKENTDEIKSDNKEIKKDNTEEIKSKSKDIKVDNNLENSQKARESLTNGKNDSNNIEVKNVSTLGENIKNESTNKNSSSQNSAKNDTLVTEKIDEKSSKKDEKQNSSILKNSNELKNEQLDSKTSTGEVKNQKVANELAKIDSQTSSKDISLEKEELLSQKDNGKKSESLIDKILNENKKDTIKSDKEPKDNSSFKELLKGSDTQSNNSAKSKDSILTNIYMSTQKKSINDKNLETKHEGVQLAKNATTTKEVESSAKVLNLGLEKLEVNIEESVEEKIDRKSSSTFDRLSFFKNSSNNSKNSNSHDSKKHNNGFLVNGKTLGDELKDSKLINMTVSPAAAQTIQNRIIGARQQMASMMSDLARTMYENYNPPVTAFRISLNPAALGSISIIIRNEQKNNSLSISMKASNSATKESLEDNQTSLKDSLFKSFAGTATSFDLDFGNSENNEDSSDNQNLFAQELNSKTNNKTQESKVIEDNSYNYL
ncbi:flagellar hook-length control protein FliK, partial [uncultured Arcobacter sp.]|uniref:flagellar hook-length control protein FliK n=1 Tax=uncultured Arcobacter sp. TaxID=165434 RepID=UPI00262C5701